VRGMITVQHTTCRSFFRALASSAGVTRSPRTTNCRAPMATPSPADFPTVRHTATGHQRRLDFPQIQHDLRVKGNHHRPWYLSRFGNAPTSACSPPTSRTASSPGKHHIIFLGKFQNLFQRGDAFSGELAPNHDPASSRRNSASFMSCTAPCPFVFDSPSHREWPRNAHRAKFANPFDKTWPQRTAFLNAPAYSPVRFPMPRDCNDEHQNYSPRLKPHAANTVALTKFLSPK